MGGRVMEDGLLRVVLESATFATALSLDVPDGDSFSRSGELGAYCLCVTVPDGMLVPAKLTVWLAERSVLR